MTTLTRMVRSASLSGYVDLASSLGLDAHAVLRSAGLSPHSLEDMETLLPVAAVGRLLALSAERSGVEDFALRLAAQRKLSNLGPISLVLLGEDTPRQALDTLCRYLRLLNASLVTHIQEEGATVIIREEMLVEPSTSLRQPIELAIGVMFRILRELIGPQWRPMRVCFAHRPPRDAGGHQAFFGAGLVSFNQEFNGLVCQAADLQRPRAVSDPGMARFARSYLEHALHRQGPGTPETVRQLIVALLPGGRCTAQQLARHLQVDRRTIHRHLAAEGTGFAELLGEVRRELVQRQLRDSDLPLGEVAGLLGFGSLSAFGYWFRGSFGCSVTQWRRRGKA